MSAIRSLFLTLGATVALAITLSEICGPHLAMGDTSPGKIAFQSNRDGSTEIYVMNADGTAPQNRSNHPSNDTSPAWSPRGNRIAFETDRVGNHEIYAMSASGANPVNLTNNPASDRSPDYAPDGSKLVFTSNRAGNYEIYTMNANGSNPVRLTKNIFE